MPTDVISRTYATVGDRAANAANGEGERTGRQRSGSTHRHYRSGSVERVHWHNNAHGGRQFEHTLGGMDRNGVPWGAQPPGGYVR